MWNKDSVPNNWNLQLSFVYLNLEAINAPIFEIFKKEGFNMPYCKVGQADIYYEDIGKGKPILMIHGYTPGSSINEWLYGTYIY